MCCNQLVGVRGFPEGSAAQPLSRPAGPSSDGCIHSRAGLSPVAATSRRVQGRERQYHRVGNGLDPGTAEINETRRPRWEPGFGIHPGGLLLALVAAVLMVDI